MFSMRAFIALLLVAAATAKLAPLHKNSEPIPGKYIIKLKDGYQPDAMASTVRVSGGRVGNIFRRVLNGFAAELSDKVLDIVRNHPAVEYVEQDGVYRAMDAPASWGLDRIDQTGRTLDNSEYSPAFSGEGVTAYVADTGLNINHVDFGDRVRCEHTAFPLQGCDDGNGHGTHCAGTVGGTTYGVAKKVNLVGVKILSNFGSGSTSGIVAGLDWIEADARRVSGPSVVSMSLGGGASQPLDDAVASLVTAGITVVVAAGNENQNACNVSPAREPDAITVGATEEGDARASYSNYGRCLDIFAPGSLIKSAWIGSNYATKTISGTSMACPHVAGAVSQILQEHPDASPSSVTNILLNNATPNVVSNAGTWSPNLLLYVE